MGIIMENGEVTLDLLCYKTGKKAGEIAAILSLLEIKGEIITGGGRIMPSYTMK